MINDNQPNVARATSFFANGGTSLTVPAKKTESIQMTSTVGISHIRKVRYKEVIMSYIVSISIRVFIRISHVIETTCRVSRWRVSQTKFCTPHLWEESTPNVGIVTDSPTPTTYSLQTPARTQTLNLYSIGKNTHIHTTRHKFNRSQCIFSIHARVFPSGKLLIKQVQKRNP